MAFCKCHLISILCSILITSFGRSFPISHPHLSFLFSLPFQYNYHQIRCNNPKLYSQHHYITSTCLVWYETVKDSLAPPIWPISSRVCTFIDDFQMKLLLIALILPLVGADLFTAIADMTKACIYPNLYQNSQKTEARNADFQVIPTRNQRQIDNSSFRCLDQKPMSPSKSIDTLPVNRRDWRDSRGTVSLPFPFETH